MLKIDRLEKSQVESFLNRIIIHGPPEELQRLENAAVLKKVCDCCGREWLELNSGSWARALDRVHENENSLVLEFQADGRAPFDFITGLANKWPKLEFALECWAYADGLACSSAKEDSQPIQQERVAG